MKKKFEKAKRKFKKDRIDLKFEIAKITFILVLIVLFPWIYLFLICFIFSFLTLYIYIKIFKIIILYNCYIIIYIYYIFCYLTYNIYNIYYLYIFFDKKNIYFINITRINIFIRTKIPFFGYNDFGPKIPSYEEFINDLSLSRRKRKYYARYLQRRIRLRFLHVYNFKTMNRRNKKPKLYLFNKRAPPLLNFILKLIITIIIVIVLLLIFF